MCEKMVVLGDHKARSASMEHQKISMLVRSVDLRGLGCLEFRTVDVSARNIESSEGL